MDAVGGALDWLVSGVEAAVRHIVVATMGTEPRNERARMVIAMPFSAWARVDSSSDGVP